MRRRIWLGADNASVSGICFERPHQEHGHVLLSSTSGPSTITLHGSLQYIKAKRPKLCFLENVYNKEAMQTIRELIKSIKYSQFVVVCNARAFGRPTGRTRMYFLFWDPEQVSVRTPVAQWCAELQSLANQMPKHKMEDFMLPDTHPVIVRLRGERSHKRRKKTHAVVGDAMAAEVRRRMEDLQIPFPKHLVPKGWECLMSPRDFTADQLHKVFC